MPYAFGPKEALQFTSVLATLGKPHVGTAPIPLLVFLIEKRFGLYRTMCLAAENKPRRS
jgi:hypothetical protein